MSNGVSGSGFSSSSSSSARVSITGNVRKMIQDIREITGKQHSDEEIYAVLKECSMDPNETIQKLMYLDTFHEVKRKRERRKESFNEKSFEERPYVGGGSMRKGYRGGHGNYGSNFSSDAGPGGARNAFRRENGNMPFSHRVRNNPPHSRAPRVSPNAFQKANGHGPRQLEDSELAAGSDEQAKCDEIVTPVIDLPVPEVNSSSEPVSGPSILGQYCSGDGGATIEEENEVGTRQLAVGGSDSIDESEVVVNNGSDQSESFNAVEKEEALSKPSTPEIAPREVGLPGVDAITEEMSSVVISEPKSSNGQHVTFPNHFQVPEALKNGLTFGSFDVTFGPSGEPVNVEAKIRDVESASPNNIEAAKDPNACDQNVSTVVERDNLDNSQSDTHSAPKLQPFKIDQPKQDSQFFPDSHQSHVINVPVPGYVNLLPPILGNPLLPYEGLESHAQESHIPIYANGNSMAAPASTNASPPLPIQMTQQSVPVFRQTYPPSFYPYSQYISPYYIPQMHQYMGHNGFAPQAAAGNMYIPQAATATAAQTGGLNYSVPQYKPANAAGNGIQPPAGSYIAAQVGYPQTVTSGSSMGNDELIAAHMKDSQIYTTGQLQSEGTGVWVHAGTGQEMPTMQMSSVYNHHIPPQPHMGYSGQQPGHHGGAYPSAAMFQHNSPSPLIQHHPSPAVPGGGATIDPIGPNHPQQLSWNTAAF